MLLERRVSANGAACLTGVAALLAVALFVQFFVAGAPGLTNPERWTYHLKRFRVFHWPVRRDWLSNRIHPTTAPDCWATSCAQDGMLKIVAYVRRLDK